MSVGQQRAARRVATEFGEVVLETSSQPDDAERCWRCDAVAPDSLDDIGLCPPCGRDLRSAG